MECSTSTRWRSCWWKSPPNGNTECVFFSNDADPNKPAQSCTGSLNSRGRFYGDFDTCGIEISDVGNDDNGDWKCILEVRILNLELVTMPKS